MRPKDRGKQSERRLPYQWAIEGDIKGCLDTTTHYTPADSTIADPAQMWV
jgi:hypothetical protein